MHQRQQGFSLVELLIVIVVLSILATLAAAGYFASKRSANEGSTVSSIRLLHGAQMTYASSMGYGEYAGSIGTGTATTLGDLHNANLIDSVLGSGSKAGYNLVGGREVATSSTPAQFFFSAIPVSANTISGTGNHRFGIATDGVIKADTTTDTQYTTIAEALAAPPWTN